MPASVGVDHGDRTKRLKASSHGTLAGPDATNHAHHGDDFWQCTQGMKDSKRRKEPGRNFDRGIGKIRERESLSRSVLMARKPEKSAGRSGTSCRDMLAVSTIKMSTFSALHISPARTNGGPSGKRWRAKNDRDRISLSASSSSSTVLSRTRPWRRSGRRRIWRSTSGTGR